MKSSLESYIEKNRDKLDLGIPDDDRIWENISTGLTKRHRFYIRMLRFAAIILILLTASATGYFLVLKNQRYQPEEISLATISNDLAEEERLFRFAISEKLNDIKQCHADPILLKDLFSELHQIDVQYASYFSDLQELGNNPKIIHGMIRCYQQKIKILEKTICEIEKNKHHENKTKFL